MPRPVPTPVFHFTHVTHLGSILRHGLVADSRAHGDGLLEVEVGNLDIKGQRQRCPVPIAPGGAVADYVPFYFAPRSPMMFAIDRGNVPSYSGGCADLVYLVTTADRLWAGAESVLFTDRNAVLAFAEFTDEIDMLDDLVDWPLMPARYWANTPEDPERRERRMAECLVHRHVPWVAIDEVAAQSQRCAEDARAALASLGDATPVRVRPSWYF